MQLNAHNDSKPKMRSLIRNVRIQYRLLTVFLLISLLP